MGLRNVSFDDRDTDHLKYDNQWFITGSWNASNVPGDPTGTLSSSDALNANVTFTFPQPANAFYYYGMMRSGGGLYAICVDCDPNNPVFTNIDALGPDDGKELPSLLFSKTFDSFRVHEILLTNQNDTRKNPAGTSQITIDRFEIQIEDDSIPDSTSSTSTPTSSPSSSQSAVSTTPSPSPSKSVPVGAIAGGVIGGLALIALCAILLLCTRRQKRKYKVDTETSAYPPNTASSSFTTPYSPSNLPSSAIISPQTSSTEGYPYIVGGGTRHQHKASTSTGFTRPTDTTSESSITGSSRSNRTRGSRRPRRELDAGRITEEQSDYDGSETLPPSYEQVFTRNRTRIGSTSRPTSGSLVVGNPDDESAMSSDRRALPPIPQGLKS
ncbi:hypothetical protein K435DRAFT_789310 [Dendrothele bispora CBS 962.96]|uniref:Mid2 domain-containing protein n=1 Tax=Dendrothele bispora (strain CBS 962.96) TaxID=1314807 RepID=A0A4S8MTF5_DENBC|nr:hypothetical protein K435DRAFT_789310 [Dendrothele bispora CBS 962.96]